MEAQTLVEIRNSLNPNLSMPSLRKAYESVEGLKRKR